MAIDKERYRRSIDALNGILTQIVLGAEQLSLRRCPYKDAENRCTARFGCRYQRPPLAPAGLKVCSSDDKLDYRKAWETHAGLDAPPE